MGDLEFFRAKRNFLKDGVTRKSIFDFEDLEIDQSSVSSYLKIGYVPGDRTLFKDVFLKQSEEVLALRPEPYTKYSLPSLAHVKSLFIRAVEKRLEPGKEIVVPLSGGMDSRIILAALLEFFDAGRINTYTFGSPGTYDYEIPNAISKHFGTKHTNFSANDTKYDVDGLIRSAIQSGANTEVFHPMVLNRVVDFYGDDALFLSGFAGDLVGAGFGSVNSIDPKKDLVDYEVRGIRFYDDCFDLQGLSDIITEGEKYSEVMSESEACFWENHVERYTAHHIFRDDMNIQAPFLDSDLLGLFLSLPVSQRKGKAFFNRSFSKIFSEFFKFPTKDYGYRLANRPVRHALHQSQFLLGALGWRLAPKLIAHPRHAYIDMRNAINCRKDVSSCIDDLILGLSERDLVDKSRLFYILDSHRNKRSDFTKDLINLASLEVILKAANL